MYLRLMRYIIMFRKRQLDEPLTVGTATPNQSAVCYHSCTHVVTQFKADGAPGQRET